MQDQGLFSAQPQDNNYYYRAERGNSSGDIRHNFSYNLVYALPVGHGQHLLSNVSGVAGKLISGWQLSSLAILHGGIANTVFIGTNTYGNFNFTNQRPNSVAGVSPYPASQTITSWLNPAAFSIPAAGTFGNVGRNRIYGPLGSGLDLSLLKDTRFPNRRNFSSAPNSTISSIIQISCQPNTTVGTAAFGQVLSTFGNTLGIGTARQIQSETRFLRLGQPFASELLTAIY